MDRTLACGAGDEGSIPSEGTNNRYSPRISTDRIQASEACDRGSIPRGGTN